MSLNIKVEKKGYSWIEMHKVIIGENDEEIIVPVDVCYKDIYGVGANPEEPLYSIVTLRDNTQIRVKDDINDILRSMETIDRVHKVMI